MAIDEAHCPKEVIEKEHEIGREQARLEGKPENMLDKIADGKVKKFLKENTLWSQDFVKNPKESVGQHTSLWTRRPKWWLTCASR